MKKRWEMTDYERLKAWRQNKHPTCWEGCPLRGMLADAEKVAVCDVLDRGVRLDDPCPVWRMWLAFGLDEKGTT